MASETREADHVSQGPELLAAGKAFFDLSSWRTIGVSGANAPGWLNDLISADIEDLAMSGARRSLFLSPTGGVLASFTLAASEGGLVLIQDPGEPRAIDHLLSRYVLSSDVDLRDRSGHLAIFAFPGSAEAPDHPGTTGSAPSALGAGAGVIGRGEDRGSLAEAFSKAFAPATASDVESWRVLAAVPRVGVDTSDGDLPQECGLEASVSFDKGCFLGQEAVAKVRNLGHPRRVLLPLEGDGPLSAGDVVLADGDNAGVVTSAARVGHRDLALVRVRWQHRGARLRTPNGVELHARATTT